MSTNTNRSERRIRVRNKVNVHVGIRMFVRVEYKRNTLLTVELRFTMPILVEPLAALTLTHLGTVTQLLSRYCVLVRAQAHVTQRVVSTHARDAQTGAATTGLVIATQDNSVTDNNFLYNKTLHVLYTICTCSGMLHSIQNICCPLHTCLQGDVVDCRSG